MRSDAVREDVQLDGLGEVILTPDKVSARPAGEDAQFDELWRPDAPSDVPRGPEGVLLSKGIINQVQLDEALRRQKENTRLTVMQLLRQASAIDETQSLQATAEYFRLPFVTLDKGAIDPQVFALFPLDFVKQKSIIPVRHEDGCIVVGLCDPANIFLIDEVKRRLRRPVKLVVITPGNIQRLVEDLNPGDPQRMDDIIKDIADDDVEVVQSEKEDLDDMEKMAGESPVIRYVNYVIANAMKEGASDIHIEPGEKSLRIRYRIDGILFEQTAPPWQMQGAIISRLKIMANMDISERRLPQDGRIQAMVNNRHVDLRISMLPITHGEKCVIRILDNRSISIGLEALGFGPDTLTNFKQQIDQPHGVVLVTGPTGSGKTTTLYSALRTMDGNTMNISTVEDPVEYQLAFANQVNVNDKIGMTFGMALRSLLRQDPDVVMVGEIRDEETARIAVQASLTGHMVLSTLHTNDAPSSITRLINIGIEPYLIAASVNAVLAQRLIRRICPHCRRPMEQIGESMKKYLDENGVPHEKAMIGAGCDKCRNTGYHGRSGIYELMVLDDDTRDIVTGNPNLMDLRRHCRQRGIRTLREDGFAKVAAGDTTIDEVLRATEGQ